MPDQGRRSCVPQDMHKAAVDMPSINLAFMPLNHLLGRVSLFKVSTKPACPQQYICTRHHKLA